MVWIYDTETFQNMFLGVYKNWKTKEKRIFETSDRINQDIEHREFLKSIKGDRMIGFNNLNYDYPLLHFYMLNPKCSLADIKAKSDHLISQENAKFNRIGWPLMEQVDVFSIRHYDNKAKASSLKKIQISMDWWNVKDSSEDFSGIVTKHDEVIEYCVNDVDSTDEFVSRSLYMIQARQSIRDETSLRCLNFSDSKLGEQLVLLECAEYHKCTINELKPQSQPPSRIPLTEIVFDWIDFEEPRFKSILDDMKTRYISASSQLEYEFLFDNVEIAVKEGGIHGALRGKFESDDEWVFMDADVSSMHPRSMGVNKIFPPHIGPVFSDIMDRGYKTRVTIKPKLKDKSIAQPIRDGFKKITDRLKLQMNSTFGKMGDAFSALYYPKGVYQVTINNQLFVLKWIEFLMKVPSLSLIYINTDGIVAKLKRSDVPLYKEQCQKFADYTNFELEYAEYKKLCIRDVNNYCGIDVDGDVKTKGEYIYEVKEDYHKSINFRVSRKAAVDYLLMGKSIEDSIKEENNIFLFTGSVRFKKSKTTVNNNNESDLAESELELPETEQVKAKTSHSKGLLFDNNGISYEVPPNLRFIYSKKGKALWKVYDKPDKKGKKRMTKMFDNKQIIDCNMIRGNEQELLESINHQQYVNYARKLANSIIPTQKIKGTRVDSSFNLFS